MKLKHYILLFIIMPLFSFGQINISETIKESSFATDTENTLYFVDFWATWCGPCITVSKQLAALQRQYPENFYIMSLSQENPAIVKRFIEKRDVGLAVAIDYNGETFSRYNISSLPYGILFNAKGEKLWEGHPAEFKYYHLQGYLRTHKSKLSVDKMFKQQSYKPVAIPKEKVLKDDVEIIKLKEPISSLQVVKKRSYLEVSGSLRDIIAYTNNVYKNQINIDPTLNKTYRVRFKHNTDALKNKTKVVLKHLRLKQKSTMANGEVLFFNLKASRFWDINQIDWGNDTPNFLIGDSEIKADNVSLNEVSYQLANLLELPIVTDNNKLAEELHDWEVHYKYFELMTSSFNDTYGIKIEKKQSKYPIFDIIK